MTTCTCQYHGCDTLCPPLKNPSFPPWKGLSRHVVNLGTPKQTSEHSVLSICLIHLTYFYVDVAGCSGVPAVLTIYTNHRSGNVGHKNKTVKFVVAERPATMYIQNSWTDWKSRRNYISLNHSSCFLKPPKRNGLNHMIFQPECGLLKTYSVIFVECLIRYVHNKEQRPKEKEREKKFFCSLCGKAFLCPSSLAMHCRTHSGDKPYSCEKCGQSFAQAGNLKKHFKRWHNDDAEARPR